MVLPNASGAPASAGAGTFASNLTAPPAAQAGVGGRQGGAVPYSIDANSFQAGGVTVDRGGHMLVAGRQGAAGHLALSFDDLDVLKSLGSGASATVKLARHRPTGKLLALKLIGLYVKSMRSQLLRELKALFDCDCDALISFHGATYREGQVAVILEFMNLGGLDSVLKRVGSIPEPVLAAMAFQMLWGLGYLAVERRIHRDLKPANILVDADGSVKLTDFGLSREIATGTLAKTFLGSFQYLSPERMQTSRYDYRSDVWSIGLVLLEAALGRYPYPQSDAAIGFVSIVLDTPPPVPTPEESGCSPEFCSFIGHCLSRDQEGRMFAHELLELPWFELHGIGTLTRAKAVTREWVEQEPRLNPLTA